MRLSCSSKGLSKLDLRCTQSSVQWVPVTPSGGVQRLNHGADHSPPYSAKVKNEWSCTFLPHPCLRGMGRNVTQSVNALLCTTEISNFTVCFSKYYSYLYSTRRVGKAQYRKWGVGYTTKDSGFDSLQGQEIFLLSKLYKLFLGTTLYSDQGIHGGPPLVVKQLKHGTYH